MKHDHTACLHDVAYCTTCDEVFCEKCEQVWQVPCVRSHSKSTYETGYTTATDTHYGHTSEVMS